MLIKRGWWKLKKISDLLTLAACQGSEIEVKIELFQLWLKVTHTHCSIGAHLQEATPTCNMIFCSVFPSSTFSHTRWERECEKLKIPQVGAWFFSKNTSYWIRDSSHTFSNSACDRRTLKIFARLQFYKHCGGDLENWDLIFPLQKILKPQYVWRGGILVSMTC